MKHWIIDNIIAGLPFVMMTTDGGFRINKAHIVETIIISVIIAAVGAYITVERLSIKFEHMCSRLDKIETLSTKIYDHESRLGIVETRQMERLERERKR